MYYQFQYAWQKLFAVYDYQAPGYVLFIFMTVQGRRADRNSILTEAGIFLLLLTPGIIVLFCLSGQ